MNGDILEDANRRLQSDAYARRNNLRNAESKGRSGNMTWIARNGGNYASTEPAQSVLSVASSHQILTTLVQRNDVANGNR